MSRLEDFMTNTSADAVGIWPDHNDEPDDRPTLSDLEWDDAENDYCQVCGYLLWPEPNVPCPRCRRVETTPARSDVGEDDR